MVVAPGPIFLLFFGTKLAKIAVRIPMVLARPSLVVDDLIIVPNVIVGVIRVVDAIVVMFTSDSR
jgi:hypothetical protein